MEGLVLMFLYLIIAVSFWYYPVCFPALPFSPAESSNTDSGGIIGKWDSYSIGVLRWMKELEAALGVGFGETR
jgi:hypothetical protein